MDEEVGQLSLEGGEVLVSREVVLRRCPAGDRVDDAVDELLCGSFATRCPDVAPEVFADDDVGGQLAPERWDLDVRLLEDRLARLVLDLCAAQLPGDLVVRMNARRGPAPLEGQTLDADAGETALVIDGAGGLLGGLDGPT